MDGYHAPFGEIIEGFDILDSIAHVGIIEKVPVIVRAGEWHEELDNPEHHDYDGV